MIGLRPILSDSQPNKMKNGVPSSERDRDHDLRRRPAGTFSVWVRKNSA